MVTGRVAKLPKDEGTARFRELSLLSLSQRLRGDFMTSYKNCQGREILKKVLKSFLWRWEKAERERWLGAKAGKFG